MSGTILAAEVLALWGRIVGESDAAQQACLDMMRRYGDPARHYHTLEHARQVANVTLELLGPYALEDAHLVVAALLHDVIYDPRAKDNEERSAEYAHEILASLGVNRAVRDEVARLILLTRTHETTDEDRDGQILLDADLSVLGEDGPAYDAYDAAIRREYAWVSDADYRRGRREVLERFLARPHIYFTPVMRERSEARARSNLAREIASLR